MKITRQTLPILLIISLLLTGGCQKSGSDSQAATEPPESQQITILYTDDEHGWMAGQEEGQGAANLLGLFKKEHGLGGRDPVLLLSGGDNWTGPAISTWFEGQGMVEVMNQMGYAASALGNHEFDFGLQTMQARISEAEFPYLSANIRYLKDGTTPTDLGIQPYTVLDVAGIKIGIVGLSTQATPFTTNPVHVIDFEFMDYETALREVVPQAKGAGAQIIVVVAHICPDQLDSLAQAVEDLAIPFMGGGHCHQPYAEKTGDTVIAAGGPNLGSYAYLQMEVNSAAGGVNIGEYGISNNQGGAADAAIAEIVTLWQGLTDAELDQEIGYLAAEIPQRSQSMQDLTTQSWLIAYPAADIALTNLGGMRDRIPAGPVTIASVINVMPFNNVLIEVKLSGEQVLQVLAAGGSSLAVGGMRWRGGHWIMDKTGQQFEQDQEYSVLVTDFLYAGGDNFDMLARFDPDAYDTAIDWRQPLIDWISAQESSKQAPLDAAIEGLAE